MGKTGKPIWSRNGAAVNLFSAIISVILDAEFSENAVCGA